MRSALEFCNYCIHIWALSSRSYPYLIRSEELLGLTLLSLHNLTHLIRFTSAMERAIRDGCFAEDFRPWNEDSPAHHTW